MRYPECGTTQAEVPQQTVDVNLVMDAFKVSGARMNILVLDACRDNPFSKNASGKGLAQQDAPSGTFLAYATAPGNVAEDGDAGSGNGLYTQYLLEELRKPASIENVFKRVRLNVRKQSNGRQIPWESTSLEEDFYFNDGVKFTYSPAELQRLANLAKQKEQQRLAEEAAAREREKAIALQIQQEMDRQVAAAKALEEQRLIAIAKAREAEKLVDEARSRELLRLEAEARLLEQRRVAQLKEAQEREQALKAAQAKEREIELAAAKVREQERAAEAQPAKLELTKNQLIQLPGSASKAAIQAQLLEREKIDWDSTKSSNSAESLYAFLLKYPDGTFSEIAEYRLNQLAGPTLHASLKKGQSENFAYIGERFKVGDVYAYDVGDSLTGVVDRRSTIRISANDGNSITANGGRLKFSPLGGMKELSTPGRTVVYEPPYNDGPVEFRIGRRWHGQSNYVWTDGIAYHATYSGKVAQIESVTVPAGTFETYRVEIHVDYGNGSYDDFTYWFDPRYGLPIKRKQIGRGGSHGTVFRTEQLELTSIQAVR